MRFKIKLSLKDKTQNFLPYNYQYPVSHWIHSLIQNCKPDFTEWLVSHGIDAEFKRFKLFTFSNFVLYNPDYKREGIIIFGDGAELIISFYPFDIPERFITPLFKDAVLDIAVKKTNIGFTVKNIERMPDPIFTSSMNFRTVSPVLLSRPSGVRTKPPIFLSPEANDYGKLLITHLIDRYKIHCDTLKIPFDLQNPETIEFQLIKINKEKHVAIKGKDDKTVKLKCYECDFILKAPASFLRFGYFAGFGEKTYLGLGCCIGAGI